MRTNSKNPLAYVLTSEQRKRIVETLLTFPERQWTCTSMEETAKLPHATVFRTLTQLRDYGILKSFKINKRDILFESVKHSPYLTELKRMLNVEQITAEKIAKEFTKKIKLTLIEAVMLYGSTVTGKRTTSSDIDILCVLKKENAQLKKKIFDIAAKESTKFNMAIAPVVMTRKELMKRDNQQFIASVKAASKVLYGKKPY